MKYEVVICETSQYVITVNAPSIAAAKVKALREAQKGFSGNEEYQVVDCEQVEQRGERG